MKMKDRIWNGLMLVTVAAALFFTLNKGAPRQENAALPLAVASLPTPMPTVTPTPAEAYRQERAQTRQRDRDALLVLVGSESVSTETRVLAESQLLETVKNDEIELAAEAALIAKGYPNSLCAARQGAITVFLDKEISAGDAALLLDIVREASGLSPENVRLTGY
ncbi:MAG: SpoIIIAH-like family protein [Clostridia bacterium]|nr:SpoIIIAH-like family protein [Clostridia bacterium]